MSEDSQAHPGEIDPTLLVSEELLQQQDAIRELAAASIKDDPMEPGFQVDWEADRFGLDKGAYDVFTDGKSFRSFSKFVSRQDPADTLIGITWLHRGGDVFRPNYYVYSYALKPNGDMIGKIAAERADEPGTSFFEFTLPVNSPDPEVAEKYRRALLLMYEEAQKTVAPPVETPHGGSTSAPESRFQAAKRRLSRWLGHSSLN